ncbi:hypothetical protein PIGHUM_02463 [Pigmentiphaga humi]|uniref:DUF2207 domain-containing protein n=2 Tax=Pigmentiphaga humi TaxID=2478468 RepID=A0A3P4B3A3_9BURK|nr:hypothetical protein PIGHUM_02463 [Pigmentiphaga humi]
MLAAACLLAAAPGARADERILEFFSDIKVERSGDLLVTENIRVRSEGRLIKYGLQRDFAGLYRDAEGNRRSAALDVLSMRRDGRPEPFAVSRLPDGLRLVTGKPDVSFRMGEYQYSLVYRVSRQLQADGARDRLAWDATGRSWALPVDKVRVRIVLPDDAPVSDAVVAARGGGAPGRLDVREAGRAVFVSTRTLAPGEGMEVDVAWPAGAVERPGPLRAWWHDVQDRAELWVAGGGAALLIVYYLLAALSLRRSGPRTRERLDDPPEGLSAPALRYIDRKGYDRWTFLAGMMELLSRRSVGVLVRQDGRYIERLPNHTGGDGRHDPLLNGMLGRFFASGPPQAESPALGGQRRRETASAGAWFSGDRTLLRLDGLYRHCYDEAQRDQRERLEETYARSLFVDGSDRARHGFYLWLAMTVALVGLGIVRVGTLRSWEAWSLLLPLPAVPALFALYAQWRAGATSLASRAVLGVLALACLAGGVWGVVTHVAPLPLLAASLAPLALLAMVCAAFLFLRGYTRQGAALRAQVDAFRRFLARPEPAAGPEAGLARYERYLPYALALGTERKWSAAHAGWRAGAAGALADMRARYGGVYDPLAQARAVMRSLDRWSATAARARPARSGEETGVGPG